MDYVENVNGLVFKTFAELEVQFGSPIFQLTQRPSFRLDGCESSGDGQRIMSMFLGYTYLTPSQSEKEVQFRRLVHTMTLERPDDESATVEMHIARHLDAAVEEDSDGTVDLGFRLDPHRLVVLKGRKFEVDGAVMDAIVVADHGYLAYGVVIGDRLLSIAAPKVFIEQLDLKFETRR